MRLGDAPARLNALLAAEGVDASALRGPEAWAAFCRFAAEPIEGIPAGADLDRLLFEAGPTKYGPGGRPAVVVDIERQYTLRDADGEYAGMRHVLCSFAYAPDALPGARPAELWGETGDGAAIWIAKVEATPWFALLGTEPASAQLASGAI